jgi:hypothetical protein
MKESAQVEKTQSLGYGSFRQNRLNSGFFLVSVLGPARALSRLSVQQSSEVLQ